MEVDPSSRDVAQGGNANSNASAASVAATETNASKQMNQDGDVSMDGRDLNHAAPLATSSALPNANLNQASPHVPHSTAPAQLSPEKGQPSIMEQTITKETTIIAGNANIPTNASSPDVFMKTNHTTTLKPASVGARSISPLAGPSRPRSSNSHTGVIQNAVAGPSKRASPGVEASITRTSHQDRSARSTPLEVSLKKHPSPPKMYRTGYVYDPLMMLHCPEGYTPTADDVVDAGDGHPEEPMRIKRIFQRLAESGLMGRMLKLEFRHATFDQILSVHTEEHWNKVQGTETLTDEYIQESKQYYEQLSLYVCRETANSARLSCGGVIRACMAVCNEEVRNAFAIVRPPGHHAEPDEHMGFCFYNNVAVAAKEVIKQGKAKKVLILDWDVHHGNGTQRAFWDDPNVLYVSIHRHDGGKFYPTSDFGALNSSGVGEGLGKSVNIPWPSAGFGDGDYIYAFQKIIMPIAYEFSPDLVIISAGFDAAEGDTLGGCNVTPAAYGHMTHMLCALAGGKVVVALEGGYNLEAISRSSLAVAQVLLGETPPELGVMEASEVATEVIHQVAQEQSKYWKSIDVKACEPPEVSDDMGAAPIPIPDLLKIHRAHHMFTKHNLFQIPLASQELEESFGGQVICNEGVYEAGPKNALVVFVHDFGNLRVETDGVSTTNVHMTNSYLLDTSDRVVGWVMKEGYNIMDVNILAQLPTQLSRAQTRMVDKKGSSPEAQLMRYIWDNYIELSEAENVVFIGHGTGCRAVMDLINHRDVQHKVKAVVQVAGMHSLVRIDPDNESRRAWFTKSNRVYVPAAHPVLADERAKKRLGGQIFTSERAKVVDVLVDVFPEIEQFIESKLQKIAALADGTSGLVNGTNGHDENISSGPAVFTNGDVAPAATVEGAALPEQSSTAAVEPDGMVVDGPAAPPPEAADVPQSTAPSVTV